MPDFYAEILRSVLFRDNNFKPLNSNDPSTTTVGWSNSGLTLNTNGDVLTITNGGPGKFASHQVLGGTIVSTSNWPYIVFRAKGSGVFNFSLALFGFPVAGPFSTTVTSQSKTYTVKMSSGINLDAISIGTGSGGDQINLDYIALSHLSPIQLSKNDLEFGTVTRAAFGFDHAELTMNNKQGKFITSPNRIGFGDHLHIYLPRQFDPTGTLYHAYGGYCEIQEPFQPNDEMQILSRGWGLAAGRTLHLAQYQSSTPRTIINDMVDSSINAAAKNGINIPSNYQLTRSFVQNIGSALGVYVTTMKPIFDSWRELGDLTTAQGTPAAFFVDPAENLHWLPLGAQGVANWTTDPIPANYGQALAFGKNQIINRFRRDSQSVRNRVHYFGVAQSPGIFDAWTENSASSWGSERLFGGTTAVFSDATDAVAMGSKSVKCILANAGSGHYGGAMFYPSAKNLGLNIDSMGSPYSPPLLDMYWRVNQGANARTTLLGSAPSIFFATDATNRFVYNLISDGNTPAVQSIMNIQGINNGPQDDYWNHIILPIGPHGGALWLNPPSLNGLAVANFTGTSAYQLANVGSPSWSNINYVGLYWENAGGAPPTSSCPFWFDGWRIIGGRYRIAYDNRARPPRYPDMAETMIWDPISKDEILIKNLAKAELYRLWNAVMRGSIHIPISGDISPEQQVQVTNSSANLNNTYLRITEVVHRFSQAGMATELSLTDDFTNSQPLERFKILNSIMHTGENAILSREMYDLKTALVYPDFTPTLDPYS